MQLGFCRRLLGARRRKAIGSRWHWTAARPVVDFPRRSTAYLRNTVSRGDGRHRARCSCPQRRATLVTGGKGSRTGAHAGVCGTPIASRTGRSGAAASTYRVAGAGRIRQDDRAGGCQPQKEGAWARRRLAHAGRERRAERVRELRRLRAGACRTGSGGRGRPGSLAVCAGRAAVRNSGARDRAARGAVPARARRD